VQAVKELFALRQLSYLVLIGKVQSNELAIRRAGQMLTQEELRVLQREQYAHDMRNHFDILSQHKTDRLKHYGLHFAKYVGRLARETNDPKPLDRTLVDAALVVLSAANTLHQDLSKESYARPKNSEQIDPLRSFADAAGRFADACEKIDHLEDFLTIAKEANRDLTRWIMRVSEEKGLDLKSAINSRRQELTARHFYIG
jgi:hypothetical protein